MREEIRRAIILLSLGHFSYSLSDGIIANSLGGLIIYPFFAYHTLKYSHQFLVDLDNCQYNTKHLIIA